MKVADFACGAGFFARAAARLVGARGVVWAVDAHQELLPRLKNISLAEGLRNVEVLQGNIERTGGTHLPEASFDLVLVPNALFASEHKDTVAKEAGRVLKKGGRVLLVDWSDSHGGLGPAPAHVLTAAAAQKIFEGAGFVYERQVPAGAYHWGVIMRKK